MCGPLFMDIYHNCFIVDRSADNKKNLDLV